MIISRILQELFPVSEHEDIHGVPNLQFLSWVLLPEVVIELIKEDLDVSAVKAVKILEDSFAYSNEMFPFDDDESDNEELGIRRVSTGATVWRETAKEKPTWMSVSPLAVSSELPSSSSGGLVDHL
jgi:hypothetical protein